MEVVKDVGTLFYIVNVNETTFQHVDDIPKPDYVTRAVPYFFTFMFIEYLIQVWKNKRTIRLNDGIVSLAHGMYLGCQEMLFKGLETYVYIKIYENYRLYELSWDSPWTWYITALGVDCGYYWLHRGAHEINFFWAQHQVHHSSEDYNLSTALRQAAFQNWIGWVFYLPLAFFIPPSVFLVHKQFNLLYQFWIHTELVGHIGPLEWILNTPRHHRVHHGSNRYCLDKNYAGVLIIWDRMFGTFADERTDEKIVYGLVEDVKSFNPFWLQIFYYPKMWSRAKEYKNWGDKLSVYLKGPGWSPGNPRLGNINDVPVYPNRDRYDVPLPKWKNIYVAIQFICVLTGFHFLSTEYYLKFHASEIAVCAVYILFSLTSIGFLLEDREIGVLTELFRSIVILAFVYFYGYSDTTTGKLLTTFFTSTIFFWAVYGIQASVSKNNKNSSVQNGKKTS